MRQTAGKTLQVADWVKGTSVNDERFRGYIEAMAEDDRVVKVHVIECDNPDAVGRAVEAKADRVERLADEPFASDMLLAMIDLALLSGDKSWFMELTAQLNRAPSPQRKSVEPRFRAPRNRIAN